MNATISLLLGIEELCLVAEQRRYIFCFDQCQKSFIVVNLWWIDMHTQVKKKIPTFENSQFKVKFSQKWYLAHPHVVWVMLQRWS